MDAERIIDALPTLTLDELRTVRFELENLISRIEAWQQPEPKREHEYYRNEMVKCGKPTCQVCLVAGGHGPYWYRFYKEHGKLQKQYIGKSLPPALMLELTPKPGSNTLIRK